MCRSYPSPSRLGTRCEASGQALPVNPGVCQRSPKVIDFSRISRGLGREEDIARHEVELMLFLDHQATLCSSNAIVPQNCTRCFSITVHISENCLALASNPCLSIDFTASDALTTYLKLALKPHRYVIYDCCARCRRTGASNGREVFWSRDETVCIVTLRRMTGFNESNEKSSA